MGRGLVEREEEGSGIVEAPAQRLEITKHHTKVKCPTAWTQRHGEDDGRK